MATVERWVTTKFRGTAGARFQAEISATLTACGGVTVYEDADPDLHPGEDLLSLLFDVAPDDTDLDDAIAAFPRTATVSGSVAMTANASEHITTLPLVPGEHISINVYVHVSLALSQTSTRDQVLVGLAPIWRESDGTVRWSALQFVDSGQIPGFSVDLAAAQLDATDIGVSLSFRSRASGTVAVIGVQLTVRTRAII